MRGRHLANRLAIILENNFASQLIKVIGRQFCIWWGFRPGFGRSVIEVVVQVVGGSAPSRMSLKRLRRKGVSRSVYVRYHSLGNPSGLGDLRSGRHWMTPASSSAVIGAIRSARSVSVKDRISTLSRNLEQAASENVSTAYNELKNKWIWRWRAVVLSNGWPLVSHTSVKDRRSDFCLYRLKKYVEHYSSSSSH